jgi:hypothetical protein
MLSSNSDMHAQEFELCFSSIKRPGQAYTFPCDARGRVDMDAMSEQQRNCYLYARAVTGREFAPPRRQHNSTR